MDGWTRVGAGVGEVGHFAASTNDQAVGLNLNVKFRPGGVVEQPYGTRLWAHSLSAFDPVLTNSVSSSPERTVHLPDRR